jgi:CRISPR-associated protein Csx10
MKIITYRVKLMDDILVSRLSGDANTVSSYLYLPGSVLKGALLKKYCAAKQISAFDCLDEPIKSIFFSSKTRFLNAMYVNNNLRSLPVPKSWQCKKGKDDQIFDFSIEKPNDIVQWERVKPPFWIESNSEAKLLAPETHISIHIAKGARSAGKPDDQEGDIFRYISLCKGQTFEGIVLFDEDSCAIDDLFQGTIHIGKSRSGGYGSAEFEPLTDNNIIKDTKWRECSHSLLVSKPQKFTLTFLSDAIIRDENGQTTNDIIAITRTIEKVLNSPITPVKELVFIGCFLVGGFNAKWGLPIPQEWSVAMGSTIVFESKALITIDQFDRLEWEGIGERRDDGFGRVCINWLNNKSWNTYDEEKDLHKKIEQEIKTPNILLGSTSEYQTATFIVNRIFKAQIEERIISKTNFDDYKIRGVRPNQLTRLVQLLQNSLFKEQATGTKEICDYLEHISTRQVTRKQFEDIKIENKSLIDWMIAQVKDTHQIWLTLDLKGNNPHPINIAGISPVLDEKLAYETTLRFLIRVLGRAVKEIQQKETGHHD